MIGIIDAVLICNQCGQKIKLKHLKCQKEKREKLISEFMIEFDEFCKLLKKIDESRGKIRGVIPAIACIIKENLDFYGVDGYKRKKWEKKM